MIITSNRTKTSKIGTVAMMSIAAALIDSVIAFGDGNMAFATKNSNDVEQWIEQDQDSEQNAECVSGEITFASCNNIGFMFQHNEGNMALGQQ
jgi:DUF4097 and DUF4098 domain-containing protein YvlB